MLINEMVVFYHVVNNQSFSKAAETLKVSKAFVSKHIRQLEKDLKTSLLIRNTRRLSLTEAGEGFYQQCAQIVELAQKSYEDIASLRNQPSGHLKISAPPALAIHLLAEPLLEYQKRYPEVTLNIVLESQIVDFVRQGYDLALRSAILPDSNLIARKLVSLNYWLCASPLYLKKYGRIDHPSQLVHHRFAGYGPEEQTLHFIHEKNRLQVKIKSQLQSNQLDFISQMVFSGDYIAVLPKFMIAQAIEKKQIQHCLPDFSIAPKPLYFVYPQKDFMPLKLKAFIDLLTENFQTKNL